jgi:FtsP/CotA-like multicopper oxidase with cupredoxin domain
MRDTKNLNGPLARGAAMACATLFAMTAQAAAPGITGPSFDLVAAPGYISQPDGMSIYSWGYGCNTAPAGSRFVPTAIGGARCPAGQMQLPGPTLIVNQGDNVSVKLTNKLPKAAGNTSILFPGFTVTGVSATPADPQCGVAPSGVLTVEAANGCTVTYTFTAAKPGTYNYYSGTQGDLQVEMGLYGALIVLPTLSAGLPTDYAPATGQPVTCRALGPKSTAGGTENDYRLAAAAYDHPSACYDREYLFQFSEIDPAIHRQAEEQKDRACTQPTGCMVVTTEPYWPVYYMINGRSFPDLVDPNYAVQYPNQPYNGNPHMHPGELVLLRIIGNGRSQHPFHEHGNHVRVLARDASMLLTPPALLTTETPGKRKLAGPLLFTTTTTPGQTMDGIFQWTGKGLNWDIYAHMTGVTQPCVPDANGYYTSGSGAPPTAPNYYEWCADHEKPLEDKPSGQVGSGGPVTLPDANIMAGGAWYGGSPYLGPEATTRAVGATPIPPSGTVANDPGAEAGFAFMWHSHNEREITTNDAFPGGMMMMMLVDPWTFIINETY